MGNITFVYVWMEPEELIDDLRNFGRLVDSEIDRGIRHRRA